MNHAIISNDTNAVKEVFGSLAAALTAKDLIEHEEVASDWPEGFRIEEVDDWTYRAWAEGAHVTIS